MNVIVTIVIEFVISMVLEHSSRRDLETSLASSFSLNTHERYVSRRFQV